MQPANASDPTSPLVDPQAPKLLDRLRLALQARRYRPDTVERFVAWNRQYILHHHKRHPAMMGRDEVEAFLAHLASIGYGAELQAQARQAISCLYREVLGQALPLPEIGRVRSNSGEVGGALSEEAQPKEPKLLDRAAAILRTRRYSLRTEECYVDWMRRFILFHNKRHPLEMGGREVEEFLTHLVVEGRVSQSTQRLMECCRLRVKDVDLARGQILVRQGKGDKDRVVMLPRSLRGEIEKQTEGRRVQHARDLARGVAHVPLPDALERKYPKAENVSTTTRT